MTLRNAQAGHEMARCRTCDHDLMVKKQGNQSNGKVYCSNSSCRFHRTSHQMRDNLSMKGAALRKAAA